MMAELVLQRDDTRIYATVYGKSDRKVMLCPPHPGFGGSRQDSRLVTIAHELAGSGISALCFDYSAYTGGEVEVKDALYALEYLGKTARSLGLLGYSYGAVVASVAAAQFNRLNGLVLVSPPVKIDGLKTDTGSTCPKLVIYGLQDSLIIDGIEGLYDSLQGEKQRLSLDTDHFYAGCEAALAYAVVRFFQGVLA
jgi:alpha/beta superfamily hydrolase